MKTIITTLLFCLLWHSTLAQTTNPWEKKLQAAKTDTAKLRICINAGDWFRRKSRNDSANFFLQKGIIINTKIGTNKLSSSLFLSLGNLAWSNRDSDKAEFYYKQCQQVALQQHDPIKHQKATFNLIHITKDRGFYPSAIKQFLAFDRTIGNKTHQDSIVKRTLYSNLAKCYDNLEDKQKYHFYIKKELAYCQTPTDSLSVYQKIFMWNSDYNYSLDTHASSNITRLSEKVNLPEAKIELAVNLSDHYIKQKEYDKAIEMAQAAIKMAGNKPEWEGLKMFGYENIGEAYSEKKQYAEALQYFAKITDYIKKDVRLRYLSYAQLVKVYAGLGDYKKAYEYSSKIAEHEEEVKGNRNKQLVAEIDAEMAAFEAKKIAVEKQAQLTESELKAQLQQEHLKTEQQERIALELRSELEISTKEKEINLQKNEITTHKTLNKLKEERIKAEKQQKNIVITLLLLSLGLLAWAVWGYRKQRQLKQLLEFQNHSLETKTKELTDANHVKDKIFAVLGHDLQSPINELKAILMLFDSKTITPSKLKEFMMPLANKIESVEGMLNNLLYWSLLELKHQNQNRHLVALNPIIERVLQQLKNNAEAKAINILLELKPTEAVVNEKEIEIVLRNLLSNAIKFTPKNGTILIESIKIGNQASINIKDTGIGLPASFNQNTHFPESQKGTSGEKGVGLGLKICKELVLKNQGELAFNNTIGGTTVSLLFRQVA